MKAFWLIFGVLVIVTAVICISNRHRSDQLGAGQSPNVMQIASDRSVQTPFDTDIKSPETMPAPELTPSQPGPIFDVTTSARSQPDEAAAALGADFADSFDARPEAQTSQLDAEPEVGSPATAPATRPDSSRSTTASKKDPAELKIEHKPDGSLLLDDRFVVRGAGTEKDPYSISWELLVSAQETYVPHQDSFEIPARISFLNGKHVRVSGFIFSPTYRAGTSELLFMRNMWDGCCIGVPPTSYDAIEVTLRQPLSAEDLALSNFGTLDGVLKVDPLVKDAWLLGLYVVENGKVYVGDF
jgi:hypothetical protein